MSRLNTYLSIALIILCLLGVWGTTVGEVSQGILFALAVFITGIWLYIIHAERN